jgi:hypothetical protein
MIAATDADASLLAPYSTEWASLCAHRHNALIEGPAAATRAVLRLLQPHVRGPIVWKRPHAPFELPGGEARALILEGVAALTTQEQARLLACLDSLESRTQVVSTTEHPLFALVAGGLFDAALYYRLNVVVLRVEVGDQRSLQACDTEEAMSHDRQTVLSTPQPV